MRNLLTIIILITALFCSILIFGNKNDNKVMNSVATSIDSLGMDDAYLVDQDEEDFDIESLNDIRFANFKDEDWYDNEYIWTLRGYLDEFSEGIIDDEVLEPYRTAVKGKFVIYEVEPALIGGMFIMFTFIDLPERVFSSVVYSVVDEKTRQVSDYMVDGIQLTDIENNISKEEILRIVDERPELKLF